MGKSLELLRSGANILTSPPTTIDDFTVTIEHMSENKINAEFYYPLDIDFQLNEYVEYNKEGVYDEDDPDAKERYYLLSTPSWSKDEKTLMRKYTCEFLAKQEVLKNVVMIDSFEAAGEGENVMRPFLYETEYSFFGGVEQYFLNIKSSMFNEFGFSAVSGVNQPIGWEMELDLDNDYTQQGEDQVITISNMTVFDALRDIYTRFKVPFNVSGNKIVVGGIKTTVNYVFRYGYNKGLYSINRSNANDSIITKIRGVGSDKNLPPDYLVSQKADANLPGLPALPMSRLMPYVFRSTLSAATAISNIKDYYTSDSYNPEFPKVSFEKFDDIYPTIKGVSHEGRRIDKLCGVYMLGSSVSAENSTTIKGDNEEVNHPNFWVKIPPLGFNLKEHLNVDELRMVMSNGQCGGCTFKVLSIGSEALAWSPLSDNAGTISNYLITPLNRNSVNRPTTNFVRQESQIIELQERDEIEIPYSFNISAYIYATTPGSTSTPRMSGSVIISVYDVDNAVDTMVYSSGNIQFSTIGGTFNNSYSGSTTFEVPAGTNSSKFVIRVDTSVTLASLVEGYYNIVVNDSVCPITRYLAPIVSEDTTDNEVWLLVQKDIDTYSTLMPYAAGEMWSEYINPIEWEGDSEARIAPSGLVPKVDDEYFFLGISLPDSYIISAEQRLEAAILAILNENDKFKYKYDCGFDEKLLLIRPDIVNQLRAGSTIEIYDSTIPTESVNPATDKIEVVINNLVLKYSPDKISASIN